MASAEQLVAEADAEHRDPAEQLGDDRGLGAEGGGVAGPVGEEDAVGLEGQGVGGGRGAAGTTVTVGHLAQAAQHGLFHAEVVGDDRAAGPCPAA